MLLLGALLILTFPAPNLEFLAWFGLVPGLVVIVRSPTAREGGMRAWWLGAGYLIAALYWMTPEIGPAVLLVGAVVGALWIPFGVAAWKLLRPPVTWPTYRPRSFRYKVSGPAMRPQPQPMSSTVCSGARRAW